MFCEKCGNQIEGSEIYCRACGHKHMTETMHTVSANQPTKGGGWTRQGTEIILSLLTLASIFFLPMYNRGLIMGEIYPNDQSVYFTEVMEMITESSDAFRYYVVEFTVTALVAGGFLFLFSLVGSKTLSTMSAAGGAVGMSYYLCRFIAQEGAENVFSFDETAICLGFWVTLFLFIIAFFKAIQSNGQ